MRRAMIDLDIEVLREMVALIHGYRRFALAEAAGGMESERLMWRVAASTATRILARSIRGLSGTGPRARVSLDEGEAALWCWLYRQGAFGECDLADDPYRAIYARLEKYILSFNHH